MKVVAKARTDSERRRALAAALSHEEAVLVQQALDAYAEVLLTAHRSFPNPGQKAHARQARELAEMFQRANLARPSLADDPTD